MKYGVRLKIDVTNIDKAKLFNGKKGTYLDATVFLDVDNQGEYGDNGMITQDAPKGEKGNILGNATVFWREGQASQSNQQAKEPAQQMNQQSKPMQEPDFDFDDDIPF